MIYLHTNHLEVFCHDLSYKYGTLDYVVSFVRMIFILETSHNSNHLELVRIGKIEYREDANTRQRLPDDMKSLKLELISRFFNIIGLVYYDDSFKQAICNLLFHKE